MASAPRGLDDRLLDALGEIEAHAYDGKAWRVARQGRPVLDGSRGAGRWNPRHLSVLYTSKEADGARAETYFHLSLGQSVFPSRMKHLLYELALQTDRKLFLADISKLKELGVEESRYTELLYSRTQEIADAAAFLGFHGIIAPSARYKCENIMLFLRSFNLENIKIISEEAVNWAEWQQRQIS